MLMCSLSIFWNSAAEEGNQAVGSTQTGPSLEPCLLPDFSTLSEGAKIA